tara:strand:- start:675 stop:1082 length:408 start_codon:yes stop_codon:yes gene_type:complete
MQELWTNNTFWRILINSIGVISILFGSWLLFRFLKSIFINNREKKLMDKKFINIKSLPNVFKNLTQICLVINFNQHVAVSLLDENESHLITLHDGEINVGEKIFVLDTKKLKNGYYHVLVKTEHQNIFRKIVVNN